MRLVLTTLIVSILFVQSCETEEETPTLTFGDIEGVVQNEFGQPIEGAIIKVESLTTKSQLNGSYLFKKLPIREHQVSASKDNYLTKIKSITPTENSVTKLDFTLGAGEPYLEISDSVINSSPAATAFVITVSTNSAWEIAPAAPWLSLSAQKGEGNSTVKITLDNNVGIADRNNTITFTSGSLKKTLTVNQSAKIKLVEYKGIIGNGELSITDSVYLLFNKPVKVSSIYSNFQNCLTEIKYKMIKGNTGVMFTYSCAKLGGTYPFTIAVTDAGGNSFREEIQVSFFKSELKIEGYMTGYLFLNNDTELLISAFYPSRLIRYSIEKQSIIKTYDLSKHVAPISMTYNPYNAKVYIIGSNPNATYRGTYTDRPDIFVLDLQTEEIISMIVPADYSHHSGDPANIPRSLAFTKSGLGIILLRAVNSSGTYWKIIDSSKDNDIYNYPDHTLSEADFNSVHLNYDETKIFLTQPNGSCDYGIFDSNSEAMSILRPTSVTRGLFITPCKKSDRMYVGQLYDQFIMDINGNLSMISYKDNRQNGSADFSYRPNEDKFIYFCESNFLQVFDYGQAKTLMWCDLIYELNQFRSTIDGRYGVAYKKNNDRSSSLYVFDTDDFHRHIE